MLQHLGAFVLRCFNKLCRSQTDEKQSSQVINHLPRELPGICASIQRSIDELQSQSLVPTG